MRIIKYIKNKIALFIPLICLVLFAVFAFIAINALYSALLLNFQNSGKNAVESIAKSIDEKEFKKLIQSEDRESPYYKKLKEQMFSYKALIQFKYLYTMIPKSDSNFTYIVDGSSLNDEDEFSTEDLKEWNDFDLIMESINEKKSICTEIVEDSWGSLVSAYTPLLDSNGNTYGFVGADFDASNLLKLYYAKRNQLLLIAILSILFIIISIIITIFNTHHLTVIHKNESKLGNKLFDETQELFLSSKENSEIAQNQSAAIREIVSTMEENNKLSSDIASKIDNVANEANQTFYFVTEGISSLNQIIQQLKSITDSNKETVQGINLLNEKTETIWETVAFISNVADQAKIIAFNAELEASNVAALSQSEETKIQGSNFHIIASEIRRLSDSIIDGTKDIKKHISQIQECSKNLINIADKSSLKIEEEDKNVSTLESNFYDIKTFSQSTTKSTNEIAEILKQQSVSIEQIFITIKQIADGVSKFENSANVISISSENVRKIANELHQIN